MYVFIFLTNNDIIIIIIHYILKEKKQKFCQIRVVGYIGFDLAAVIPTVAAFTTFAVPFVVAAFAVVTAFFFF